MTAAPAQVSGPDRGWGVGLIPPLRILRPSALTVLLGTGTLASSTSLARPSGLPSSAQALASQLQPLLPPMGHLLCAGTLPTMPHASFLVSQEPL